MSKVTSSAVAEVIRRVVSAYRQAETPDDAKHVAVEAKRLIASVGRNKCAGSADYWLGQALGSAHNMSLNTIQQPREDLTYMIYCLNKTRKMLRREEMLLAGYQRMDGLRARIREATG